MDQPDEERVSVKIIRTQGKTSLIEWEHYGRTFRGSVLSSEISEKTVSMETLENATLYGLDFSTLSIPGALELEKELHSVGIWTADEVLHNRTELLQALNEINLAHLRAVITFAKNGGRNG